MIPRDDSERPAQSSAQLLAALLDNRLRFLAFVERRVGSRADAEEILQAAFARSVEAASAVRADEGATAWFYRVLRNAIVDHSRRRGAEHRALDRLARELPDDADQAPAEVRENICACVGALLQTLRPEQGDLLRKVDLQDRPVHLVAEDEGITAGSARVRLHRARQALRERVHATCGACAEHGCMDCTCRRPAEPEQATV